MTKDTFSQTSYYSEIFSFYDTLKPRPKTFYRLNSNAQIVYIDSIDQTIYLFYDAEKMTKKIQVPKIRYSDGFDTIKTTFSFTNNNLIERELTYSKECYKEREGHIVYDNTHANVWRLIKVKKFFYNSLYQKIQNLDIDILTQDTIITKFYYDNKNRIIKETRFKSGIITSNTFTSYNKNIEISKDEDLNSSTNKLEKTLVVRIERNSTNKTTRETKVYLPSLYTEIRSSTYNEKGKLKSVEFYGPPDNLFRVEKYYY